MKTRQMANAAFAYSVAALAAGAFYREFTKFNGFTGRTTLGFVHPHLLALGGLFLLAAMLCEKNFELSKDRRFSLFFVPYQIGLCVTAGAMLTRGVAQVLGVALSRGMDGALSGVAGLGHIALGFGLIVFFLILKKRVVEA